MVGGRNPRVVVLDAAGTLLELERPVGETYAAIAREAGVSLDPSVLTAAFHREFRAAPPLAFGDLKAEARGVAERDWWRRVVRASLTRTGVDADLPFEPFFDAAWERFAGPAPWRIPGDVRPGLRALRRRGVPLAVLSNWDGRLEGLLGELGLHGYFARVLLSAELPAAKPDARAFAAARDALGELAVAPPVMVGDRMDHDVEPAVAAGWGAIWLDRKERGAALPAGSARVRDLRELAGHPLVNSA
ncbi:MAG: HAD family hydrolase [Gemmatimonadota bacterium]